MYHRSERSRVQINTLLSAVTGRHAGWRCQRCRTCPAGQDRTRAAGAGRFARDDLIEPGRYSTQPTPGRPCDRCLAPARRSGRRRDRSIGQPTSGAPALGPGGRFRTADPELAGCLCPVEPVRPLAHPSLQSAAVVTRALAGTAPAGPCVALHCAGHRQFAADAVYLSLFRSLAGTGTGPVPGLCHQLRPDPGQRGAGPGHGL
ncbi:hypothetical protein D3C76_1309610 [compost metagenome]